jgi:hypothetical protein
VGEHVIRKRPYTFAELGEYGVPDCDFECRVYENFGLLLAVLINNVTRNRIKNVTIDKLIKSAILPSIVT